MERKNKKDKIFNILLQIPCAIEIIFSSLLIALGEKINILITVLSILLLLLLFISGYGLTQNKKKWNIVSFISIIIFTIWYCILGYFDYIKWTSTIL